jgi:hypothetical protein
VPLEVFQVFVNAQQTGGKVPVASGNTHAVPLLANEFKLEQLLSECPAFQVAWTSELSPALPGKISELEHEMACQGLDILAELKESLF